MGFISDLLTNITAFRIKIGEKLIWLNNNKADKSELPSSTDFITTNTHQTDLSGNKETSGSWLFAFKNNTWYKDSLGNERLFFGTGSNANGMLFRLNDDAQRFQFRDKENAQIAAIASNGRITSLIDGNSSQWKQAYDQIGNFKTFNVEGYNGNSYIRNAILLCAISNTSPQANRYTYGTIFLKRNNGLQIMYKIDFVVGKQYDSDVPFVSYNGTLAASTFCTVEYEGMKYIAIATDYAANAEICIFEGQTNQTIQAVPFYNKNTGTILNEEVYNSIAAWEYENAIATKIHRFSGHIETRGYVVKGSSDDNVVLAGGSVKPLSDFVVNLDNYYTKPESVNLFVGVNNTQTIAGTKTFTNSPVVPNPTLDSHAASKGWVNSFGLGKKIVTSASGNTWDLEAAQDTRLQAAGDHGLSMGGTMWGFRVMSKTTGYGEAFGMKNGRAFMRSLTPSGQTDFLEFWHSGNLENPATEAWVNNQGFIKSVPDNFVTKDNRPSTPLQTTVIDFDDPENGASILYAGASSTNAPSVATGTQGGMLIRGNHSSVGEYQLYIARQGDDSLLYRNQTGVWRRAASREWVNAQGFVTTDTKYTAGNGLTLSGTQFSLPVTVSGTGTYVQKVEQNANGITVTLGTPPNTNTTYPAGTKALIDAGTDTTNRVWNSKILKDAILEHGGSAYTAGPNVHISADNVISATDTVYVHPTNAGNKHIPAGGSQGDYLKYNGDGTAMWARVTELDVESDTDYVALFEANL